jgi:hypothetical protein
MTKIYYSERDFSSRKEYLVYVAVQYLKKEAGHMGTVEYDEAECDALCLADDLYSEFDIDFNF